ncbi:MAG: sulfotransferase family protein [Pirellulales bacterium]|nr:sulfotransferase family protein [Pirellulales bacterium]
MPPANSPSGEMLTDIVVVSGLPRSGTSLMMQMLAAGGMPIVTDKIRAADSDNPHGYCEFEAVKRLKHDSSWVPGIRGQAVKLVSQLLYDLPVTERYRVILMERNLQEIIASQEKMLVRLGQPVAPRDAIQKAYLLHLQKLHTWLEKEQSHLAVLPVSYNTLLAEPHFQAARIRHFLSNHVDSEKMLAAIDPGLYRNRVSSIKA